LNFSELEKCVEGTFEGDSMSLDDNSVLKDHANEWQLLGTHLSPAMVINNRTFRGRLTPDNVFEAICASFNHEPKQCRKWQEMEGIPIPRGQSTGITQRTLFYLILILISVNVIIILAYRRYLNNEMQRDMKLQVSSAVSQYVALSQIPELDSSNDTSRN
jgi:hypothetical protein